jgi:hypothetical protein
MRQKVRLTACQQARLTARGGQRLLIALQEIHWPIILGLVASQFMKMSQNALHARISATLVMVGQRHHQRLRLFPR